MGTMFSYLRRRLRGWDGLSYSEPEIRHLPQHERKRLTQAAWEVVRYRPPHWLMRHLLLTLFQITFVLAALLLVLDSILYLPFFLLSGWVFLIQVVGYLICFRQALRQILPDAGIRPAFCFECGYDLERYEGNACPACGAPLLRQADFPPERS